MVCPKLSHTMSTLLSLTSAQLKQAANIKDQIEELNSLLGSTSSTIKTAKKGMSAAGRAKVAAAQKKRWGKIKKAKPAAKPVAKKRKMNAAGRARIAAAAKARWAKVKAAGKSKL